MLSSASLFCDTAAAIESYGAKNVAHKHAKCHFVNYIFVVHITWPPVKQITQNSSSAGVLNCTFPCINTHLVASQH